MIFDIWNIYSKLPKHIQALLAALLAFFFNISVTAVVILSVSVITHKLQAETVNQSQNVLGVHTKRSNIVFELFDDFIYLSNKAAESINK